MAFASVTTTAKSSKLQKSFDGTTKGGLGYWQGLKIICIGPKGGKIVGYDSKGKAIYAGSPKAQKLVEHGEKKPAPHVSSTVVDSAVDEWMKHLGFAHVVAPGVIAVTKDEAQQLHDAFGVTGKVLGANKYGFTTKELLEYVGKPLTPSKEAETTFAAAASAGVWDDPPFSSEFLKKLKVVAGHLGGSHAVQKVVDDKGNFVAVWKPEDMNIGRAEEAFSRVAQLVFPKPSLYSKAEVVSLNGQKGALLSALEGAQNVIGSEAAHKISKENLQKAAVRLAQHHVLDWLLSNHDGHGANFFFTPDGDVGAFDKGQAFKFIGNDSLDLDYNPNHKPVGTAYQQLWKAAQNGELKVSEQKLVDAVAEVVNSVEANLSTEQYHAIVQPYLDETGPSASKKWKAMEQRLHSLRSDFEHLLSTVFKHPVKLPQNAAPPAITTVETKPAPPPAVVAAPPKPVETKPISMPGWPMKIGKVTVHHPGEAPPPSWPSKYPGPGYKALADYKGTQFEFVFDVKDGKPSVTVKLVPPGATAETEKVSLASGMTIQQAADVPYLHKNGLDLWMSSTEKKAKKIGYSATKLLQIDAFAEHFKNAASATPSVAAETPKQLEEQHVVEPAKQQLSVYEQLQAFGDGLVTDTALLPIEVQDFVNAHSVSEVGPGWYGAAPGAVLAKKFGKAIGLYSTKVGEDGTPEIHVWTVDVDGLSSSNKFMPSKHAWQEGNGLSAQLYAATKHLLEKMKKPAAPPLEKIGSAPAAVSVSGTKKVVTPEDYASLPIGAKVATDNGKYSYTKIEDNLWQNDAEDWDKFTNTSMSGGTPLNVVESAPPLAKVELPPNAPKDHAGPLPIATVIEKDFKGLKAKLTVEANDKFHVAFPDKPTKDASFSSLSAACDHVWVVNKGFDSAEDYKKKNATNKVPSGGGWKFWGLKTAPTVPVSGTSGTEPATHSVAAPTAPVAEPVPVAAPTPVVSGTTSVQHGSVGSPSVSWLSQQPVGTKLTAWDNPNDTYVKNASGHWDLPNGGTLADPAVKNYLDGVYVTVEKKPVEKPGAPKPLAWHGMKKPTPAEMDALPVGTKLSDSFGLDAVKNSDGTWKYGTQTISVHDLLSDDATKYKVIEQPGSYGWGGEKLASHEDLAALPQGSVVVKLHEDDDGPTKWKKILPDTWIEETLNIPHAVSTDDLAGMMLHYEPPYSDVEVAEPAATVAEPVVIPAQPAASAPVKPAKVVTDLQSLTPQVAKVVKTGWDNAEEWANTKTASGKTLAQKSPLWLDWVPPPGLFVEGTFKGKPVWFTTSSSGYTDDGEPSALVEFTVVTSDGKAFPGMKQTHAVDALTSAIASAFYDDIAAGTHASANDIFNLEGASFPPDVTLHSTIAPPASSVLVKPVEEMPASEKTKSVTKKIAIVDVLNLAETKQKYGSLTTSPAKYPGELYLTLKGSQFAGANKALAVEKINEFIAAHGLSSYVKLSAKPSNYATGAYAVIKEAALQHEFATTMTVEEAAVTAPETTPAQAAAEAVAWPNGDTLTNPDVLASAPDGTQLHVDVGFAVPVKYVKVGPSWLVVQNGKVGQAVDLAGIASMGSLKQITAFNAQGAQIGEHVVVASEPATPTVLTQPSLDILKNAPDGSKLKAPSGYTYSKVGGSWHNDQYGDLVATHDLVDPTTGKTPLKYELTLPVGAKLPAEKTVDAAAWVGQQKGTALGSTVFANLPKGTVVYDHTTFQYWKHIDSVDGGDWVQLGSAPEEDNLDGAKVSSVMMADSNFYSIYKLGDGQQSAASSKPIYVGWVGGKKGKQIGEDGFASFVDGTVLVTETAGQLHWVKKEGKWFASDADGNVKGIVGVPNGGMTDNDIYKVVKVPGADLSFQNEVKQPSVSTSPPPATPATSWNPPFKTVSSTWTTSNLGEKVKDAPQGAKLLFSDGFYAVKEVDAASTVKPKTMPAWQLYNAQGEKQGELGSSLSGLKGMLNGHGSAKVAGVSKVPAKPKPKPVVKPKTPEELAAEAAKKAEQEAKIAKAKEFGAWAKAHPNPAPDFQKQLAYAAQLDFQKTAQAGFYVYGDGKNVLLGSPDIESLKNEATTAFGSTVFVDTPLGQMLKVEPVAFAHKYPQGSTIVGPDGKTYPHGTTFQTKQVPAGIVQDELAKEPGFHKVMPNTGDVSGATKAVKFKPPGATNETKIAAVKATLAKHAITPKDVIAGSSNTIAIVETSDLEKPLGFKTEVVPTTPKAPPAAKLATPPFASLATPKRGDPPIENKADIAAFDAVKPSAWGHAVRCGDPGVLRGCKLHMKKLVMPDGTEVVEVFGDLMKFDGPSSKLKLGKHVFHVQDVKHGSGYDATTGKHVLSANKADTHELSGYVGKTDSGTTISVGDTSKAAYMNQFTIRIPVGANYEEEVHKALSLAIGEEKATKALVQHDADMERRYIKAQMVRAGLGAGGFWDKTASGGKLDLEKYGDESWLDGQLEQLGLTQHVATSKLEVGPGGIHHVVMTDLDEALKKSDVKFVSTAVGQDPDSVAVMIEHIGRGVGIPSRRMSIMAGTTRTGGTSASDDEYSGGATSTFSKVSFEGQSASGWGVIAAIYHPRALRRAEYYSHPGDGWGTTSMAHHKKGTAAFNVSDGGRSSVLNNHGSGESVWVDGVAMEDVMGVACKSKMGYDACVKAFKTRFPDQKQINGVPVEEFFFVGYDDKTVSEKSLLKEGVKL